MIIIAAFSAAFKRGFQNVKYMPSMLSACRRPRYVTPIHILESSQQTLFDDPFPRRSAQDIIRSSRLPNRSFCMPMASSNTIV